MKHTTRFLFTVALMATASSSAPIPSRAGNERDATHHSAAVGGPAQEGVHGMVCRFGIGRGWFVPGSPMFGITGGACILALLDAIF